MAIPKYLQIKQSLLYEINNGKFKPGEKFYSETEIKKKFNVSSITAVKALQCLTHEGYLVRYQGKGTYISKSRKGKVVKFFDIEKYLEVEERTEVIEIQKMKDEKIANQLNISPKEHFYKIVRLRFVDNKPILVQNTYIISEFINENDIIDKDEYQSVYNKISRDYGINLHLADSKEITEIVFPAPKKEGQLLDLEKGEPCAFTKRYTYLFDGRTIEYIETYKRWDYFSIEIKPI